MDNRYRGGMARFGLPGVVLGNRTFLDWRGVWTAGDGADPSGRRFKHAGWSASRGVPTPGERLKGGRWQVET